MPYELVKIQPKINSIYFIFIAISLIALYLYRTKRINKNLTTSRSISSEYFNEKDKLVKNTNSNSKKVKKVKKYDKAKKVKMSKGDTREKIKEKKQISKNIDPYNSYNLGVCSKNCCATQWPVPINLNEHSHVKPEQINKIYKTSNLTCNNGVINTGCVCLTKDSGKLLGNRGYVDHLPLGNGLFNEDNRTSAFKLLEDQIPRPLNVIGQTNELIGSKNEKIRGKDENKYDNSINKYRTVNDDIDLSKRYSMPINNNMIFFDNEAINDAISINNVRGSNATATDRLLLNPLGIDVKDIKVNRK